MILLSASKAVILSLDLSLGAFTVTVLTFKQKRIITVILLTINKQTNIFFLTFNIKYVVYDSIDVLHSLVIRTGELRLE